MFSLKNLSCFFTNNLLYVFFLFIFLFQLLKTFICKINITNFMGYDLAVIVTQNFLFIGSYGIDTNVICMIVLFRHKCYMSICVVYIRKLCTYLLCLNNAWHSCLNDTNPWNNKFYTNFERTHEAYKFVLKGIGVFPCLLKMPSLELYFNLFQ